ncbi:MAG: Hsp20/alpha crystallin family protein [Candidatus Omnitrophica bacterium]|nr:Hsp20/alpha crystallin family protein [Candidatus Omnitrophota bacterium]
MTNFPIKRNQNVAFTPFSDLENLQREMNRLFDFLPSRHGYDDTSLLGGQWAPAVDIYDSKDSLVVKADLPGLTKDDIEVSIQENILTISGEKKQESKVNENDYLRTERFYGSFHRAISLPTEVERGKVQANFKDGVLELTLPKKEETKPLQIKIDVK